MLHINVLEEGPIINSSVAKEPAPNNSQSEHEHEHEHGQLNAVSYIKDKGGIHSMELVLLTLEAIHQLDTRSRSTQPRYSECDLERFGGYAFPPLLNLVPAVLNKVLTDQTEIVLVAPVWQAQT